MYIYRYESSYSPSQGKRLGFREYDSFMRSLSCVLSNTAFKSLLLMLYGTLSGAARRAVKLRQSMMKTRKTVRNCQCFLKSGSCSLPDDCFSGFPFKWDTEQDRMESVGSQQTAQVSTDRPNTGPASAQEKILCYGQNNLNV